MKEKEIVKKTVEINKLSKDTEEEFKAIAKRETNKYKIINIIFIGIIVFIAIECSAVFISIKQKNDVNTDQKTGLIDLNNKKNVKIENNQKVNASQQLKKEKQVEGIVIKNIELKTKTNTTNLIATIENKSSEIFKARNIKIIFKNQDGSEFASVKGYIDTVEPGKTVTLNIYTMIDVANAYDFEIDF